MQIRDSEGAVGLLCESCNGRWLPHRYIDALKHQRLFPAEKFIQLVVAGSVEETTLACPSGCGVLTSTDVASIRLDWCRGCKGVWFDKEELTKALGLWARKDTSSAWSSVDIIGALISAIDLSP